MKSLVAIVLSAGLLCCSTSSTDQTTTDGRTEDLLDGGSSVDLLPQDGASGSDITPDKAVPVDGAGPDVTLGDSAPADVVPVDMVAEDVPSDESSVEDVLPVDVVAEDVPSDVVPVDVVAEDVPADESSVEDLVLEDVVAEDVPLDEYSPEDVVAEDLEPDEYAPDLVDDLFTVPDICVGSCEGIECGDDGCGGECECAEGECVDEVCVIPTCDDGIANGTESDVDCGGECPKCKVGRSCEKGTDCIESICANDLCAIPVCEESDEVGIPVHTRVVGEDQTELDIICRPAASVFSLAVLPDTQMYTAATSPYAEMFTSQTNFLRVMYNHPQNRMIFGIHLGDVVNNAGNPVEWPVARAAVDKLATFTWQGVEHYLPYDIAWGDHDVLSYWDSGTYPNEPRKKYSEDILTGLFGAANYKEDFTNGVKEWWKGFFRSYKNRFARNSYHFFDAGGDQYMILFLEYCPGPEVIKWAADRLSWYAGGPKDRRAILVMHSFIDTAGGLHDTKYSTGNEKCWEFENGTLNGGSPSDIFTQLVVPFNVHFVLNGHDNGGGWKGGSYSRMKVPANISGAADDRAVHVFLSNYQYVGSKDAADNIGNGDVGSGLGYFRMMRFYPEEDRIHVSVWSEYSNDNNDGKWNPTYAEDDPDKLNPLNFAGKPSAKFNEDEVCTAINPEASNPGRCQTWKPVSGICGDLESYADQYELEHEGPPYRSYVTQCNRFSIDYPMSGSDSIP